MKPTLQLGDNGEDIKFLQSILNKLGYVTSKEIDNMYNYNIEKAVKIFQIDEGLTPDGIVGSKTWVRLLNYEK
jgi:peptidoglycan hydrolase-like protein with peptidoglycan-binding domain